MLRHYRHRGLTTVGMMAGAVLLAATSLGTGLASAAGGDVRNSDLTSILALYRDGASGLGIPALFVTGTPPERSIGVGDANRDGHADLAVREDETDTLWMLQGNGAGGFGGPTILPAHERQKVLAIGDFNEDGLDDHAVAESLTGGARLLFGDGSGGFHTTSTPGTFPAGAVLVADLNEDGNRDLVVLDGKAGRVVVSLGNAEGRYGVERPVAVGMAPGAMATGDFNMDGSLDLAVAGSETLTILLGDGKGGFAAAREFPVGLRPASLAVSDFDGDGRADVVVADRRANHLSLLFGDGQGGFGTPLPIAEASWFSAEDTAVSDASEQGSGNKDAEARSSGSQAKSHADAYEGVASLTLIPTFVTGGTGITSFGTVTLNAPAPPGGVVVTLTSSNVELAATVPSITIPAGASQGTFTIATNAFYRRYSGLAFNVTISATHAATVSATLNVTAPPPPADFTSGSQAGSNTQWSGLMCGGIAPIGGNNEILYSCSPATGTGFGSCTFRQECAIGCRRVPPGGGTFNDFCATTGPNAVTVSRNYFVSGDHVPATVVTEAPVTIPTTAVPGALSLENNARSFSPNDVGGLHFPTNVGATSIPFDVTTSYVPSIEFVDVHGFWYDNDQPPFLILNGRGGHAWGAMLSVDPPPAQPIPTPVQFKIVGANPVTGGQGSLAQLHLSGIPHGIGPIIAFTSSHPAIVPAPASIIPAASNILGFDVPLATQPPAADTNVTLTATDGRYSFSAILTVLVPPPAPLLSGASVNPTSVVGGNSATVTVTLSAQQSSATVVRVSIIDTAPATLPANIPACSPPPPSRCTNVTVPAGATSASFTIATSAVTGQFNLNITADLPNVAGITNRDALLLITPVGAGPALATLTLNPTTVAAGNSSTGTVTLTAAAPSGGAVVSLSSSNFNTANVPGTVTVPVGATSAAFTVPTNAAVTASSTVTIFAGFGVVTRTADLTVTAVAAPPQPLLATLALNPTSLMGGNATTGTVTLSAAQSQAQLITLISALPAVVAVPANITVPAFATSASFTITTRAVTGTVEATIIASLGVPGEPNREAILTLTPAVTGPTLAALTFNPTSVAGGTSSSGTVTLSAAAPTGGAVVPLAGNTAAITVPANVTVAAGASSATFTVTTRTVTVSTTATISGILATMKRATLVVSPPGGPTLSALSLSPTSVVSGNASTGTVTLSAAAPAGGAAVSLSSNSTAATVPGSVTVAAGQTSATFTVTTGTVTGSTTATISATLGTTQSAALTVNPPPPSSPVLNSFSISPGSVSGGTSATGTVRINTPAPAGGVVVTLSSQLPNSANGPPNVTIPAGASSATFTVTTFNVSATTISFSATLGDVTLFAQITVNSPTSSVLNRLTVNPTSVAGGTSSTGTVTLAAATPETAVVRLSSNNPAASVPASVTIGVGGVSATFTITTTSVTASTPVVITAIYGANTQTADLTVSPAVTGPTLSAVSLNLTSVCCGGNSSGTVTLTGAAPTGGALVTLASNTAAAIVSPASVTVTAGATSANFTVATLAVTTTTTATISAMYGGTTRSATLTLNSGAATGPTLSAVTFSPTSVAGGNPATGTVTFSTVTDGAVVFLASSNPGVVAVPAETVVNGGASSGAFPVTTTSVTATTTVTVTAIAFGRVVTGTLAVSPATGPPTPDTVVIQRAEWNLGILRIEATSTNPNAILTVYHGTSTNILALMTNLGGGSYLLDRPWLDNPLPITVRSNFGGSATSASAPAATLSALSLNPTSVVGGNSSTGTVTLSAAAPNGGAIVALSDNATAATVPTSVTVAAGATSATFTVTTASVTASTAATISGTLGATQSAALTINPPPTPAAPSLISPAKDATPAQPVTFDWSDVANTTSYEIQVDDSSTIAAPFVANQIVSASQVTIGSLPAQRLWWRVRAQNAAGVFGPFSSSVRFSPQTAPGAPSLSAVSVNPTSVVGGASSTGTVTLTSAAPTGGAVVSLSSNNGAATVPASVTVAAGATSATFTATTSTVTVSTAVTITGTFGGATRTATLTVNPAAAAPSLSAVTVNPTSVTGGSVSTGTVTLTSAAPTGGAVVSLSSNNGAATVPASVTVAAGATSATFTATTSTVTISTAVTITGAFGGATRTATLTVNPAGAAVTLTVTASGRSGERVTSSPAGINVTVGSTGAASFTSGTAITLSVTNGRDALWSGACSSGGNKTKTCTFTITGNASVTGNVQ